MKITAFLQKKPEVKATNVDIREAFTLWDILNSKYTTKERLLMFNSFAEDPELRLLLGKREKEIDQNVSEKLLQVFEGKIYLKQKEEPHILAE